MPWRRDDIRAKVEERAAELGRSLTNVAGYPTFFAPVNADKPPRIDILERIAEELDWSLCKLLCDTPPQQIDEPILALALTTATRAVPGSDPGELAPLVAKLYALLVQRGRQGLPVSQDYLDALIDTHRR